MKVYQAISLARQYGENTTLGDLARKIQGNKIHICPKCGGTGKITKRTNTAQYWECCEKWEYYSVDCDLCHGEGYTKHEYKPKMVQEGWE